MARAIGIGRNTNPNPIRKRITDYRLRRVRTHLQKLLEENSMAEKDTNTDDWMPPEEWNGIKVPEDIVYRHEYDAWVASQKKKRAAAKPKPKPTAKPKGKRGFSSWLRNISDNLPGWSKRVNIKDK